MKKCLFLLLMCLGRAVVAQPTKVPSFKGQLAGGISRIKKAIAKQPLTAQGFKKQLAGRISRIKKAIAKQPLTVQSFKRRLVGGLSRIGNRIPTFGRGPKQQNKLQAVNEPAKEAQSGSQVASTPKSKGFVYVGEGIHKQRLYDEPGGAARAEADLTGSLGGGRGGEYGRLGTLKVTPEASAAIRQATSV